MGLCLRPARWNHAEVAVEVFCGDAAMGAQEGFEALVATVDGLECNSPRTRSPFDWLERNLWLTPRAAAQGG